MSQSVAVLGSKTVPLTQQVMTNQTLTVLSGTGVFNGSAAATFLPCLSFYDSDGNLISRATAPQVAAGASAEVSWFPRVAAATAATGTASLPVCRVSVSNPVTISTWTPNIYTPITWNAFQTNDSSTFAFPGSGGTTTVRKLTSGVFRALFLPDFSGFNFPVAPGLFIYTVAYAGATRIGQEFSINHTNAAWAEGNTNASGRTAPALEQLINFTPPDDITVNVAWTGAGSITFTPQMYIYRLGNTPV